MENKRGQGLSTNAIILIILGVAILVILIIGFTYVWGGLGERIKKDNIATIVSACQTACSTQSVYDFCSKKNELIDEEGKEFVTSCQLLASVDEFIKYGLESCAIDCKVGCEELEINGETGVIGDTLPADAYDVSTAAYGLETEKVCSIAK
jgi:hypothetical protein